MTIIVRCGTLIDGSGRDPVRHTALVIEGDTIVSVGPEGSVPRDAMVMAVIMKDGQAFKNTLTAPAPAAQMAVSGARKS